MPAAAPLTIPTATGVVHARFTTRLDGDLSADRCAPHEASARWAALAGCPVTWLDQQHTADVVVVHEPAEHTGTVADASATDADGAGLAVWVGDCAPVLLVADSGAFAVAHAGWRGLAAGVLERALDALRTLDAGPVRAWLGPCIHACCYEFGAADLGALRDRYGDAVAGTTAWGTPALDVPAAVRAALTRAGVDRVTDLGECTGCDDRYWSFRRRGDMARHGLVAWRRFHAAAPGTGG